MKTACVYKIRNKITGKCYIGSSMNFRDRIYRHVHQLRTNQHHSIRLQRAWNKYGEEAFDVSIVKYLNCKRERYFWEDHFIIVFNACGYGYNMAKSTRGGVIEISEETRRKMSTSQKRRNERNRLLNPPKPKIRKERGKKILQYTLDGQFLAEFPSQQRIQETFGYSSTNISMCATGVIRQAFGFLWRFKEQENFPKKIAPMRPYGHNKIVCKYDENGQLLETFPSAKEASLSLGLHESTVSKSIKNNAKSGGFLWKYQETE